MKTRPIAADQNPTPQRVTSRKRGQGNALQNCEPAGENSPVGTRKPANQRSAQWVFVDVDGTLFVRGTVNAGLLAKLRTLAGNGALLVLWSSRGGAYAAARARQLGCWHLFEACVGKPDLCVDDKPASLRFKTQTPFA